MLDQIKRRASEIGITLKFDPSVAPFLSKKSFSEHYGARPLRRAVIRLIEDPLSSALLEQRFQKGDTVLAKADDTCDCILFEKI